MNCIYLDYAATSPVLPEVYRAMRPYTRSFYGNPSSPYSIGQLNRIAINHARASVADLINAGPEDIFFTSGGTESDNWAIKGFGISLRDSLKRYEIITTKIEHSAVLESCKFMNRHGFRIRYIPVNYDGKVLMNEFRKMVSEKTAIVSVMLANNEIGTIQPIKDIAEVVHEYGAVLHVDAVQAFGHIPIDVKDMGIDLLSASGHKIGAAKGIGCLYVSERAKPYLTPYLHGGHQEDGFRGSTENVSGIVGFGKACEIAKRDMEKNIRHISELRDHLIDALYFGIGNIFVNGPVPPAGEYMNLLRLPNNLNIWIKDVDGSELQTLLSEDNIFVSTGSACNSYVKTPSHVLKAIGLTDEEANNSLRITLGAETTWDEVEQFIKKLKSNVKLLRDCK